MKKTTISYDKLFSLVTESIKRDLKEANVGNEFEANLAKRLASAANGVISDKQAVDLMKTIVKTTDGVVVKHEGGLNQKRVIIAPDGSIVGPGDIGQTVTDITLETPSGTKYLSVKYGNTLKISNIGISNWFKEGNDSCAKFFSSVLSSPKDAKNVAASFIGWFKTNENSKMADIARIYDGCCSRAKISSNDINDFLKKCITWAKSAKRISEMDKVFSEFLMAVDKNGKRNDPSRSMVATWLASLSKEQYKSIFGRPPHNFQKHTTKFTTNMNGFGFPSMAAGETDSSSNFEEYLFNRKHPVNEAGLKKFIATCVGYGYWMVHGNSNGSIDVFKMTSAQCKSIADSVNCSNLRFVQSGKGINISIECDKIANLQFQFRNAHAGIVPDELLINYAGYRNIPRVREFG